MEAVQGVIKDKIMEATKVVEEQLDLEIEKLDNLEFDDIRTYRENRLRELKKEQQMRKEWLAMGHGEYTELDEREFFSTGKKCPNTICHFYKTGSMRCKIVDNHLNILAPKHLEAKFCKLNVEKAPFLTERLNIYIVPTILIVKDSTTVDRIVGFTDLGNCDDFSTEMLEWRMARSGILKYSGDISVPPENKKGSSWKSIFNEKKKTIRSSNLDDNSDDEFLND